MVYLRKLAPRPQAPCEGNPYYTWDWPDGTRWATFYRMPSGFMLRFQDIADFEVSSDGRRVTCAPRPEVSEATTDHLYRNQVLPLALSKLGKLVFHASAVEAAGGAIAFLGESGRGKSTLAAGFAADGHRFLTDDGFVLEYDRRYMVQPGHASLRLWRDSQERLLRAEARTGFDHTPKAQLLASSRLAHCDQPRPLLSAYFLDDGCAEEVTFRRLTGAEALIEWAKHSFLLDVEDKALLWTQFQRIATLANSLPCYRLDYPRRYDDLNHVLVSVRLHAGGLIRAYPLDADTH